MHFSWRSTTLLASRTMAQRERAELFQAVEPENVVLLSSPAPPRTDALSTCASSRTAARVMLAIRFSARMNPRTSVRSFSLDANTSDALSMITTLAFVATVTSASHCMRSVGPPSRHSTQSAWVRS